MYAVGIAPSAERDIERIVGELRKRAQAGTISSRFPDRWFDQVEGAIIGLRDYPDRHPWAPEREAWGRDVRNILLDTGYRVLYQRHGENVWVLRVRHQRQKQLGAAGPGSAYRPDEIV